MLLNLTLLFQLVILQWNPAPPRNSGYPGIMDFFGKNSTYFRYLDILYIYLSKLLRHISICI